MEFTLLGTGSSGGVPRLGPDWGVCDPKEPKNRRMRCSALLEVGPEGGETTNILIDTSPDFREQILRTGVTRLDSVLFTHDHADQCHGIDDLRLVAHSMRARVPVRMMGETHGNLIRRFGYCFNGFEEGGYPAIIENGPEIVPGQAFRIEGPGGPVDVLPLDQDHGAVRSLGFRFGPLAYCNDVVQLPEESLRLLVGVDVFVVDALRYTPHPTHAHLERALEWAERIGAARTVLTNLHIDMDYATLRRELPENVEPSYDGMSVVIEHDETSYRDRFAAHAAYPPQ